MSSTVTKFAYHTKTIIRNLTYAINVNPLLQKGSAFSTMKQLEKAHWDYIDNHCPSVNGVYGFKKFLNIVFHMKGIGDYVHYIDSFTSNYEKDKKLIPTAGSIIIKNNLILLVKVYKSPVFSFPKGKQETGKAIKISAASIWQ